MVDDSRTRNRLAIPNTTCMYAMELPFEERCEFVKNTEDCSLESFHIFKPYDWIFCTENELNSKFGILAMFCTLLLLFLMISIVADVFVCPNIAVIARTLKFSDNIAGVTLLAFGNGSPDLFTSFAGADSNHPEILYAGMTGSALFVTALIAGLVVMARPFYVDAWPLVVNLFFMLLSYSVLFGGFYFRNFRLAHCAVMLSIYTLYIVITIAEEIISAKFEEHLQKENPSALRNESISPPMRKQKMSVTLEVLRRRKEVLGMKISNVEELGYDWKEVKPLIMEFIEVMNPVKKSDWDESNIPEKIFLVFQGVNLFWMKIFIPSINPDLPHDGWCKLLIMINMALFPLFSVFSMGYISNEVFGQPIWLISLGLGLIPCVIVFFTTRSYAKPNNHVMFSAFGFVGAILMIRVLANEVIIHLQTIGAAFTISQPLLSLTCLSFGNSLGDLVINYGLAKQGMQKMAFAACFGSAMFNCSLGVGLISAVVLAKIGHPVRNFYGALSPAASLFLFLSLLSSLIFLPLFNFEARKMYGLFLITLYMVYTVLICLMEDFIHPFGTQYFRKKEIEH